jgi:hypothetical protein
MQRGLYKNTAQDMSHLLGHHLRTDLLLLLAQKPKATMHMSYGVVDVPSEKFYPSEYQT